MFSPTEEPRTKSRIMNNQQLENRFGVNEYFKHAENMLCHLAVDPRTCIKHKTIVVLDEDNVEHEWNYNYLLSFPWSNWRRFFGGGDDMLRNIQKSLCKINPKFSKIRLYVWYVGNSNYTLRFNGPDVARVFKFPKTSYDEIPLVYHRKRIWFIVPNNVSDYWKYEFWSDCEYEYEDSEGYEYEGSEPYEYESSIEEKSIVAPKNATRVEPKSTIPPNPAAARKKPL